jgi:RNA polymerase sigma factor (sigma-70 family)
MEALDAHRGALFGLCYRMLGVASDAEDVVQETFRRFVERPPKDREAPLRPWLLRVATNLCIDALRKRQRERYFGPWLPSPVDTDRLVDLAPDAETRYGALESASLAFLVALEALDAKQRAVIVLSDVLGMSAAETAEILEISPQNVRVIHHRARKALETYEAERNPPTPALQEQTASTMRRLMAALAFGSPDEVIALLSEDIRSVHDGNGEFHAAVKVLEGRELVVRVYSNITKKGGMPIAVEERSVNGLPALCAVFPDKPGRYAKRIFLQIELGRDGRVSMIRSVLATKKLGTLRFP